MPRRSSSPTAGASPPASKNQKAALDLVEYLTSTNQQLAFAKAFGVMPSVQSAAKQWEREYPQYAAFLDEAPGAEGMPNKAGTADAISNFDTNVAQLATTDPKTLLASLQSNLTAALKG